MGISCTKGDLGESKVMANLLQHNFKVAIPYGSDWRFDLIAFRRNKFIRILVKYARTIDGCIPVRCSKRGTSSYRYFPKMFDYLAVYNPDTDNVYYLPSRMLKGGRERIHLRLDPSRNNQEKNILWAWEFSHIKIRN